MTALALGPLIAGSYRVQALIASGGQAHVYRAEQAGLRRKVAIKLLQQRRVSASSRRLAAPTL